MSLSTTMNYNEGREQGASWRLGSSVLAPPPRRNHRLGFLTCEMKTVGAASLEGTMRVRGEKGNEVMGSVTVRETISAFRARKGDYEKLREETKRPGLN